MRETSPVGRVTALSRRVCPRGLARAPTSGTTPRRTRPRTARSTRTTAIEAAMRPRRATWDGPRRPRRRLRHRLPPAAVRRDRRLGDGRRAARRPRRPRAPPDPAAAPNVQVRLRAAPSRCRSPTPRSTSCTPAGPTSSGRAASRAWPKLGPRRTPGRHGVRIDNDPTRSTFGALVPPRASRRSTRSRSSASGRPAAGPGVPRSTCGGRSPPAPTWRRSCASGSPPTWQRRPSSPEHARHRGRLRRQRVVARQF